MKCASVFGRALAAAGFVPTIALALTMQPAIAQLPAGFVYLRNVDPTIAQDIRYASSNNFVGRPLPGYEAAECVVRQEVAAALKRVQASLAGSGLSLKVYDCYRPTRAVHAMAAWAHDGRSGAPTKRFFPQLQKSSLFALGYISPHSQHSTGIAVDLTLIPAASGPVADFDPKASYGACTAPNAERSPDNSVDMGTGYDCFDNRSHTASGGLTAEQRRWRNTLLDAMRRQGFYNYHREWWHFSYSGSHRGASDFPIRPLPAAPSSASAPMPVGR
jgi:D-alanyl-D-alanine dipeptidase